MTAPGPSQIKPTNSAAHPASRQLRITSGVTGGVAARYTTRMDRTRQILRALLATAYLLAGILHVFHPAPFLGITPAWVPYAAQVILVTGLCEIAGAIGLFIPRLRWWAGVMLALYAVCVYPANVKHAVDYIEHGTGGLSLWYHIPRLLFQPVIVWWALFAGRVIDWPFAGNGQLAEKGKLAEKGGA